MPPKKCKFCKKILGKNYYNITRSTEHYKTVDICSHCKFIFDIHFDDYKRDRTLKTINDIYGFISFDACDYDFKIKRVVKR